jgi:hypothetical protein
VAGGLYVIEDMRPINELRMKAWWKLGRASRKPAEQIDRAVGALLALAFDLAVEHQVI